MQNIEIKSTLPDRGQVEQRLEALNATPTWVRRQRDRFFEVPKGWLKLREEDDAEPVLIAYQRSTAASGPRASHYEIQTLTDAEGWARLLSRVLPDGGVVEKERTLWSYQHTRVHLDRVKDLGDYLELETVVKGITADEAEAESRGLIDGLRLDPARFVEVPYLELLRQRHGL